MSALNSTLENFYFNAYSATCQKDSICLEVKQFCVHNGEGLVALTVSGHPSELADLRASNGAIYLDLNDVSNLILKLEGERFLELRRYLKDAYDQLIYLHLQKDGMDTCKQSLPDNLIYPARLASEHVEEFARYLHRVKFIRGQ